MNTAVLALAAIVATFAFAWLSGGLLTAVSWTVARLGSEAHRSAKLLPKNESDAWLFVLLVGISRVPIILLATLLFASYMAELLIVFPNIVPLLRSVVFQLFMILLVMRLLVIFIGGLLIGGSVRNVIKTLKS